jgi:hypothetical protein
MVSGRASGCRRIDVSCSSLLLKAASGAEVAHRSTIDSFGVVLSPSHGTFH